MNTFHKLLLQQLASYLARARGSEIPHLLDLVITDGQFIHNVETLAPLVKTDHSVLMIEANVLHVVLDRQQNKNDDKGDYDALRSY